MQLDIKNGRVNLDATAVPVRQILAEWARIGGTRVVGAEKILGSVTLKLVDMPERQALDLILRNVAGYMAAPRVAASEVGQSAYSRIVVLPTSAPPVANTAVNTGQPQTGPGGMRMPPRPPEMEKSPEPVPVDQPDNGMNQPVFTFPQQPSAIFNPPPGQPTPFGVPVQNGNQPVITLQPNANGQPTIYNFMPTNGAPQNTPGFTVIGSPTPGMVQQPAQQPGMIQPVKPPPK